jgi:guanine deaminase
MTLYRATFLHTPTSPFADPNALQAEEDGALLVWNGEIVETGSWTTLSAIYPAEPTEDLRGGLLLPGFVDTHVHYPQLRIIGGLGLPLLDWLERVALPEEARFGDAMYAGAVAKEFCRALISNGTTTALAFGSHFAAAIELLFAEAERTGLRLVAGQVVSDRLLRTELHTTPEHAYREGRQLIERWHGRGRLLYAVTPRFSLSASEGILDACAALMSEFTELRFTSHINENLREIETVRGLFPGAVDYLATYERAGLITNRSVLAHNVHPLSRELEVMGAAGCTAAHCPCSNASLGSGLFPLKRHLEHGVRVSLGSDVGGGTGFSMLKEGLQAHFMQQLLGPEGVPLSPAHLLYLATRAGAEALGLGELTGDFNAGRAFDAVLLRPQTGSVLEAVFERADSPERALAAAFASGTQADVEQVWVGGERLYERAGRTRTVR